MRSKALILRGVLVALCTLGCLFLTNDGYASDVGRPKRVLIIATGSRLSPGFSLVDQGVLEELAKMPSGQYELYAENLDIVIVSSKFLMPT